MSDTAHKKNTESPVDVEGLDEIFETGLANDFEAEAVASVMDKKAQPEGSAELAGMYTVEEVAEKLDISKNAVQKRISRGKLKAKKIDGKYGKVWMIDLNDEAEVLHVELDNSLENEPVDKGSAEHTEAQPDNSAMDKKAQPEGSAPSVTSSQIDIAWQMELLNRVERLSQENGELKALLGEREKEINLLTDQQTQKTKWQKFMNWFLDR